MLFAERMFEKATGFSGFESSIVGTMLVLHPVSTTQDDPSLVL